MLWNLPAFSPVVEGMVSSTGTLPTTIDVSGNSTTSSSGSITMTGDCNLKLHKSGYYKLWPDEYYQDVVVSRQKTYKRIFGGQYDG